MAMHNANVSAKKQYIPPETVEQIRVGNDIVEVISECGIPLRPAGAEYKALCPFHDEKTPSFTVAPQKQIFHCFGCQTGGNVINFLQKHEAKTFIEALEWLADRANIPLPTRDAQATMRQRRFNDLSELNRFAVKYYHEQLRTGQSGQHARAYLKNRGVQPQTFRLFQLGYAKPERRDLVKAATHEGWSIKQLVDAGLIKDESEGPQDRFWNRLLFPICNERGVPVGFGGRAISEGHQPKYLNSPATVLYNKSNILYNLDKARQSISKTRSALLVEGYMDALMLYQHGIENVIAASGTALSGGHAALLKRFTPEVILVYDGDASGLQAAHRGLHKLLEENLRVRVALMPPGDDPDSFVKAHGSEAFNELVSKSINLIEFQIQSAIQQRNIRHPGVKTEVIKEISETLVNIKNRVERAEYVKYTVRELDVAEELIWRELRASGLKEIPSAYRVSRRAPVEKKLSPRGQIEAQLVQALIQAPHLISDIKTQFRYQDLTEPHFAKIAQLLWEASEQEEIVDIQNVLNTCADENLKGMISNALLSNKQIPNLSLRIQGCLKKLRGFLLQDIEKRVRSNAIAEGNDEIETLRTLVELSNQRRTLGAQPLHKTGSELVTE